jgi:hypothetical protein
MNDGIYWANACATVSRTMILAQLFPRQFLKKRINNLDIFMLIQDFLLSRTTNL